jgi:phosphonate transport system substrate-binding protein
VSLFAPADYNGVIQGLLGGHARHGLARRLGLCGVYVENPEQVEPVLVKTNLDGSFTYHSIGIARADSGIASLADMEGKVFGFGDPNSTSGYLIPLVEIPAPATPMEPGEFFGDVVFTGGHEQTILAVANGDVDAGVTWADGLGDFAEGYNSGALRKARCGPRRHERPRGDLALRAHPRGPRGAAHRPAGWTSGDMTELVQTLTHDGRRVRLWRAAGDTAGSRPSPTRPTRRSSRSAKPRSRAE